MCTEDAVACLCSLISTPSKQNAVLEAGAIAPLLHVTQKASLGMSLIGLALVT